MEAQSPNYWASREVPRCVNSYTSICLRSYGKKVLTFSFSSNWASCFDIFSSFSWFTHLQPNLTILCLADDNKDKTSFQNKPIPSKCSAEKTKAGEKQKTQFSLQEEFYSHLTASKLVIIFSFLQKVRIVCLKVTSLLFIKFPLLSIIGFCCFLYRADDLLVFTYKLQLWLEFFIHYTFQATVVSWKVITFLSICFGTRVILPLFLSFFSLVSWIFSGIKSFYPWIMTI